MATLWINAQQMQDSENIVKDVEEQSDTTSTVICNSLSTSSHTSSHTLATDECSLPQHGGSNVEVKPRPPISRVQSERLQSLREKRRQLEIFNEFSAQKRQVRSLVVLNESDRDCVSEISSPPSPPPAKKSVKSKKSEAARTNRMIERLTEAETQLHLKIQELSNIQSEGKRRMRAIQERAELQLRLSQIEGAREFYQQRVFQNATGPVPLEVLKVIACLPKYQPRQLSLKEELDAFMKNLKDEDPEEVAAIYQEIRDWEDTEENALDVGMISPDFCLHSHTGKRVDSKSLRRRHRLIVVFYHSNDSPLCKLNLIALERIKKTFEREGAQLLAIGFESDTTQTVEETLVTFPCLADEAGIVATKFGLIRIEERPILSTFIIDTDGTILWRYVNCDYTQRPEPLDILEALPAQTKRRRKFFRRD